MVAGSWSCCWGLNRCGCVVGGWGWLIALKRVVGWGWFWGNEFKSEV